MRKTGSWFGAVAVGMLIFNGAVWGLDLQEGRYEITSKTEMAGLPMQIPPVTVTQCLTQNNPVPDRSAGGQSCRITDMQTRGNTVSWKMECDQQGARVQSTGNLIYQGDSFQGTITTQMGPEAGNMVMTTVVNGKRTGACQ